MVSIEKLAGQTIGKYRIEALFGEGGMAYVYRGTHLDLDLPIAFKVLFPEFARQEDVRKRFRQEARLQFRLRHPNVVRVIDLIDEGDLLGMVMDWVQGNDLANFLKNRGQPIPNDEILRIFIPILEAVNHAHEKKIVHRDLKPANILLEGQPGAEVPKVMDFGIAKSLDEDGSKTKTGLVMGTPYYLAPEQARGSKLIDHRADIYSLGVTLYQMLTARLPYDGDSAIQIITSHCMDPIPPLRSVIPTIDPRLEHVIEKSMAKEPGQRFPTCLEFATELREVLLSSPSSVPVDLPPTREMPKPHPVGLATGTPVEADPAQTPAPTTAPSPAQNDSLSGLQTMHLEDGSPQLASSPNMEHTQQGTLYPKQSNMLLWVLLAGVGCLFLVVLVMFLIQPKKDPPQTKKQPGKKTQKVGMTGPARPSPKDASAPAVPDTTQPEPRPAPIKRVIKRAIKRVIKRSIRRPGTRRSGTKGRKRPPVVRAPSRGWSRKLYKQCYRCVRSRFRRLSSSMLPGMTGAATCNYGDYISVGKRCASRCGRRLIYYCVAFLRQRFRGSGPIAQYAGTIPICRRFTTQTRRLRTRYKGANSSTIKRCQRNWRRLSSR